MLLLIVMAVTGQGCGPLRVRAEWRTLPGPQQTQVLEAMKKLKERIPGPSGPDMAQWNHDQFVQNHYNNRDQIHGTPSFLVWHRFFILGYEKALQSIDNQIMLPFWDWYIYNIITIGHWTHKTQ
jgi:tyrosinase